jgi:hypothetical protein
MAYVSLYEAIRVIARTTPDAAIAETMTDAWIKRGALAVETSGARRLVPSPPFQHVDRILEQAIKSTDVRVMVMVNGTERAIADHERDYQLEIRAAMLLQPFGRPPIRDVLINADDLRRFALKLVKAPELPPRTPEKESIPEAAGAALRRLYPVRPPGKVKDFRIRVQQELGIESISETTFKRVMANAWGKPRPK